MRKKLLLIPLALLLALSLVAIGCPAPPPTTPTTTPPPTTTAPTTEPLEVIELTFSSWNPPVSPMGITSQLWADKVNELSEGRVEITCYFAESLVNHFDTYRAAQTGLIDVGFHYIGEQKGIAELSTVLNLPFMGLTSMRMATATLEELYNEFPEMQAEWQGVKPMGFRYQPPSQLHTTKRVVRVPIDVKGMKLIADGPGVDFVVQLGGAPITLAVSDWYMSLERGLVEGQVTHFPVCLTFKTLDLFNYDTYFGTGGIYMAPEGQLVNLDTWNSLPPDIQEVFEEASRWRVEEILTRNIADIQKAEDYARDRGNTFIELTPEEIELWKDAVKPIHEQWITEQEAKGQPGRAIYEEAVRIIAEYNK